MSIAFGPSSNDSDIVMYDHTANEKTFDWEKWSRQDDSSWFENSAAGNCLFDSMAQIFYPYDVREDAENFKRYVQPLSDYIRKLLATFERRLLLENDNMGFNETDIQRLRNQIKSAFFVPDEVHPRENETQEQKAKRLHDLQKKEWTMPQMVCFMKSGKEGEERFVDAVNTWTNILSQDAKWGSLNEIICFHFLFTFDQPRSRRFYLRWLTLPCKNSRANPDKHFVIANSSNVHFRLYNYIKRGMLPLCLRPGRFADVFGEDSVMFKRGKEIADEQHAKHKEFVLAMRTEGNCEREDCEDCSQ